jgi:hypothetical protein
MTLLAPLFRAIDAPARETLLLEKRTLFAILPPALLGAVLIAAASLAGMLFTEVPAAHFPASLLSRRTDTLRAIFEALAIVFPSAIILAAYLGLRISPRAFAGALSIALLIAGVVALFTLPLMAFLALVARARPMVAPSLFIPFVVVGAIAATTVRILKALDPRTRATFFAGAAACSFVGAFLIRALGIF